MSDSKNNTAWEKLFAKHRILQNVDANSCAIITSSSINEFREARLMTKFDHKSQLPKLFSDNQLSILPISRGSYLIGRLETFHNFNDSKNVAVHKIEFPNFLESLDFRDITSEATAINCAYVTGILQHFSGDEQLSPTVSGRMSSSSFHFDINARDGALPVSVSNSQVEIDGGYEGLHSLNLIEAKNYLSDDFLVRQLFYPFRLWSSKVRKTVRPVFLTYTNGIFHLREYKFFNPNHYNSLTLVSEGKYIVQEGAVNVETIQRILSETAVVTEPLIPFPQADSFERVINLCENLKQKSSLTRDDITQSYDFAGRQTNYYADAGRYLAMIDKRLEDRQVIYSLTPKGEEIFELSITDRQLAFAKMILAHLPFRRVMLAYFENGEMPSKDEIVKIMKTSNLYKIDSDITFYRRASTIISWINWIMGLIEE